MTAADTYNTEIS